MVERNPGFRFEGLKIWQQSRSFINMVCSLTEKFPRKEDYALTAQLNRAVYSIGLNIAEGSGRNSVKEFLQFLGIAKGSLFEVLSGLMFALDRGYITKEQYDNIYSQGELLGKSLNTFKKALNQKNISNNIPLNHSQEML
jgi:four helix bundle protein